LNLSFYSLFPLVFLPFFQFIFSSYCRLSKSVSSPERDTMGHDRGSDRFSLVLSPSPFYYVNDNPTAMTVTVTVTLFLDRELLDLPLQLSHQPCDMPVKLRVPPRREPRFSRRFAGRQSISGTSGLFKRPSRPRRREAKKKKERKIFHLNLLHAMTKKV
jgi:hypothetical protein